MYCTNCGNKVDEKAYICVNCGVILNKQQELRINNIKNVKKNNGSGNATGIISIVFASIAVLLCLCLMNVDISEVGMYANVAERIFFGFGFNIFPIIFTIVSLILGFVNLKNIRNKIGLSLSFIAIFLIITEFAVIILY